jgi:hypothetical protein
MTRNPLILGPAEAGLIGGGQVPLPGDLMLSRVRHITQCAQNRAEI